MSPGRFSHTAEAATVKAVLDECQRQGVDEATLVAATGLDRGALQSAEEQVAGESVRRAWGAALALTGDPLLGLHAAEHLPFGEFGVPDFVAANAPTARAGLERLCRYFRIITSGGSLSLETQKEALAVRYEGHEDVGEMTVHIVDFTFACVVVRFRLALEGDFAPREVWYRREGSAGAEEYARVYDAPVRFDAPYDALLFAPEMVDRPIPGASLRLSAILEKAGDEQLARLPSSESATSERVRQILHDGFDQGDDLAMGEVARRLAMSQRTLQRRLGEEGSSFKEVRERVREELAKLWLGQPQVAISEVAFLLGFSEPSAFHRAFKRWAGQTPAAFRESSSAVG